MSCITAKADSGATKHYFSPEDTNCLQNICKTQDGPSVFLPNMEQTYSTHSGLLPYDNLLVPAKIINRIPKLQSTLLVSLGQLCDDNYKIYVDFLKKSTCVQG